MHRLESAGVSAFAVLFLLAATWLVLPFPGTSDVGSFWLPWMRNLDAGGLVNGYAANRGDYPPGSAAVLWTAVHVGRVSGADHFTTLKCSILLFLCASSFLFWLWTRSVPLAAAFHLALLPQSLALGYIDVYFALPLLATLWALDAGRLTLSACCFAAACLTKWQPLIVAPFVLVHVFQVEAARRRWTAALGVVSIRVIAPAAALAVAALWVFGPPVLDSLHRALSHEFLSGYALNFPWIVTHWIRAFRPEAFGGLVDGQADFVRTADLRYTLLPRVLFAIFYAGAIVFALRRPKTFTSFLRAALLGYLAYFTFNTGVHENHLLLAVILGFVLYWRDRTQAAVAVAIALLSNINLVLFYGVDGTGYRFGRLVAGVDMALILAVAATAFFLAVFAGMVMDPRRD